MYFLHYISADSPAEDSTWSVYREAYDSIDAEEPIDGTAVHVGTYATEAEADRMASHYQRRSYAGE